MTALEIGRIIQKHWLTIFNDEWLSYYGGEIFGLTISNNSWSSKYDENNKHVCIRFGNRKQWWLRGDRVSEVKPTIKEQLESNGLRIKNLKIKGGAESISWMNSRKYVGIYQIEFDFK